VKIIVMP